MSQNFFSALVYPKFVTEIDALKNSLYSVIPSVFCYTSSQVLSRLIQRLVEIGLVPYVQKSSQASKIDSISRWEDEIELGPIKLNIHSGTSSLRFIFLLKSVAEFWLHWFHALYAIFVAFLASKREQNSATLIFGVGIESIFHEQSDLRFYEFCQQGPISPLKPTSKLIVQANTQTRSRLPSKIEYSRFPLFSLLRINSLNVSEFLKLLAIHTKVAAYYFAAITRLPLLAVIGRDFAYHAVADNLNRRGLINSIVITNSNYSAQPLWMNNLPNKVFKTHMVWYAQNTVPIVYKDKPIKAVIPNYLYMQADEHWVWTKGYAEYLRGLGTVGEIHVVGPIVWQLPNLAEIESNDANEVVISIFDVTPVNDSFAQELGLYGNYYNAENMINFIDQIMLVVDRIQLKIEGNIRVLLKHKRGHHSRHSQEYIARINDYIESCQIAIVPFNENVYKVVAQSAMVIVVPYSSPAYIADALNIPAIFFDPTGRVFPTYEQSKNLKFISSDIELERYILSVLGALEKRAPLECH